MNSFAEGGVNLGGDGRFYEVIRKLMRELDYKNIEREFEKALREGASIEYLSEALRDGMAEILERYNKREVGMPEVFVASWMADRCLKILYASSDYGIKKKGKIIIGTVGSPHEGGKELVRIALELSGFEVHDIGVNLEPEHFVERAREIKPDIVASSCMVLYAKPLQKDIERRLREAGLKGVVKTLIGGAVTSQSWAEEIGADGYARDLLEAVEVAGKLMGVRGESGHHVSG
jgi:5-methyltetrahydrofolate--homocysteine methyltransferase